jgi:hypothetical protein
MISGVNPKLLLTQNEDGNLELDKVQAEIINMLGENKKNWKLVRSRDGLTKQSREVIWIEFNDDGTFKAKHDEPEIGRSLLMSPFNNFFTWQTTAITKIIATTPDSSYIKFETENSEYELTKIT